MLRTSNNVTLSLPISIRVTIERKPIALYSLPTLNKRITIKSDDFVEIK